MTKFHKQLLILHATVLFISLLITPDAIAQNATIQGVIFHDLNGNGIQDVSYGIDEARFSGLGFRDMTTITEPSVEGATISFDTFQTITDKNGGFSLSLPTGEYLVSIEKQDFRFYFGSNSNMVKLDEGIPVTISGELFKDFGIGKGCFTLPYKESDFGKIQLHGYTDIDPAPNKADRYNAADDILPDYLAVGTINTHRGIDFWVDTPGSEVVAMAPGMVYAAAPDEDGMPMIIIIHSDYENVKPSIASQISYTNVGLQSSYHHLDSFAMGIEPGIWVERGQVIGTIGDHEAYRGFHLHAEVVDYSYIHLTDGSHPYVDLFKDTFRDDITFLDHQNCGSGFGWFSYANPDGWQPGIYPYKQTVLNNVPWTMITDLTLPVGEYTFYFALDDNMDGKPDATWFDSLSVQVFELDFDFGFDLPNAEIVIDGNPDDWLGLKPILSDSEGDSTCGAGTDIKEVYFAKDDTFLYWRIDTWTGDYQFEGSEFGRGPGIYFRSVANDETGISTIEVSMLGDSELASIQTVDVSGQRNLYASGGEYGIALNIAEGKIPLSLFTENRYNIGGWYHSGTSSITCDDFFIIPAF